MGVMAPSQRTPDNARAYRLPENSKIPAKRRAPAVSAALPQRAPEPRDGDEPERVVHVVPCAGFENGESLGVETPLERMRPESSARDGSKSIDSAGCGPKHHRASL